MAIPFGFIMSGVMAIKDIVGAFGNAKSSDDKFRKVEEFIHEQNKINAQQVEYEKEQEAQIDALKHRVKKLEYIVLVLSISAIVFIGLAIRMQF